MGPSPDYARALTAASAPASATRPWPRILLVVAVLAGVVAGAVVVLLRA